MRHLRPRFWHQADALVKVLGGVVYVACLDCALEQLEDDDDVDVSVLLLRKLKERNGWEGVAHEAKEYPLSRGCRTQGAEW